MSLALYRRWTWTTWMRGLARGYVEPSEAAWDVIEKVVTPYFHDLEGG
jgi:hypothetical protein